MGMKDVRKTYRGLRKNGAKQSGLVPKGYHISKTGLVVQNLGGKRRDSRQK